jgi:hypothetical protein
MENLKIDLPFNPAIPFLAICPKECKVTKETPAHPCLF